MLDTFEAFCSWDKEQPAFVTATCPRVLLESGQRRGELGHRPSDHANHSTHRLCAQLRSLFLPQRIRCQGTTAPAGIHTVWFVSILSTLHQVFNIYIHHNTQRFKPKRCLASPLLQTLLPRTDLHLRA